MPTGGSERANKQQRVASAVYAVDVHVFILSFIFYYMYITAPTQDATVLASKCPAARNSNDLCAFTTFLHSSLAPEQSERPSPSATLAARFDTTREGLLASLG